MRKLLLGAAVFFTILIAAAVSTAGSQVIIPGDTIYGGELRVGLTSKYSGQQSVTIINESIAAGYQRNGFFYAECTFNNSKGFTVSVDSSYYVRLGSHSNYNDAKLYAASIKQGGRKAAPCMLGAGLWAVYAGGYESLAQAQSDAQALGGFVAEPNTRRVVLMEQSEIVLVFDSPENFPQFAAQGGGQLSLGDRKYRGRVELARLAGNNLTAINIVNVDEYLYSVVPSEMPPKWHIEALKAQTIASRSYIVNRKGVHSEQGYDMCDTEHCQVYLGASNESESTTSAVNATRDIFIWYDGKPISAVFFASSGGITDNSENVWSGTEPYLRSVSDTFEKDSKEWSRIFTLSDINNALAQDGSFVGSVTGVSIGKTENNRVQELIISGTLGVKTLQKEAIRTFFSSLAGGKLESRNFIIMNGEAPVGGNDMRPYVSNGETPVVRSVDALYAVGSSGTALPIILAGNFVTARSNTSDTTYAATGTEAQFTPSDAIIIKGKGVGHGVGMSQYGAQGMAEAGYTYDAILKWFYTGVEVRK